ncbi:hypothetical protein ACFWNI_33605 [Streptomyces sp. NPDC058377]|uniref:hypothetical protein n=1 Tax=Streptomyces sp. NPDC058377 TaxID=3346468 RepID=UPI003660F332
MTAAHLRYAALGLAAISYGGLALLYARASMWPYSLACLVLTGVCAEACSWVRRADERLHALEAAARPPGPQAAHTAAEAMPGPLRTAAFWAELGDPLGCPFCPPDSLPIPSTHWAKHLKRHHSEETPNR